ncbi:TonB dependent receptor [Anatilimnocola aggregata]|uniref:TonB dependent receptor n=1 Tax=Anatilimnocola aggregata TaxID=2528021 RepID=A0A517YHY3_9BACT|nr:TonB-dependent receptor [Anatilimnocola aggregata]QDU29821.1 TonB dependent receptor [Anatilimnocola aggregata]
MRLDIRRYLSATLMGGAMCWSLVPAHAADPQDVRAIFLLGDGLEFQHDPVRLISNLQEESTQPFDPSSTQPFDPSSTQPFDPGTQEAGSIFGPSTAIENLVQQLAAPGGEAIGAAEAQNSVATDVGSLIQNSENIQTVGAQRRSQIAYDPRVRAYRYGQIYAQAEGQNFLPVRLDLDSMVSKIDPALIQSITVIPGPYGLRFGPGFSYIDIDLIDTPRYDCPETHGRLGMDFRSNGGQTGINGTAFGGGSDYGYLLHWGMRNGADYTAGNGQKIPSSYHAQNVMLQFGWDLSPNTKSEVRYSYLDVRDTEYALQFFDINAMNTNALNWKTTTIDPCDCSVWTNQIWYNQTSFSGDNQNESKRGVRGRVTDALNTVTGAVPPDEFEPDDLRATVNGELSNFGARTVKTYGDDTTEQFRYGADFRYITQRTREDFFITDQFNPGDPANGYLAPEDEIFFTQQPRSVMTDPGIFAEVAMPWFSFMRTTAGARLDYVNTHPPVGYTAINEAVTGDDAYNQNDILGAGYLVGDIDLSQEWSVRVGAGYAERAPNLSDRYADGVFISMLQTGFSRVIGTPSLEKEKAIQFDTAIRADYEFVHLRASFFYSWIRDYNTYINFGLDPPTQARLLLATNTPLATLNGFELYGDYNATDRLTYFASLQYVEGQDQTINAPLPGIYPLESRLGIRFTDCCAGQVWGTEWGWRLVAAQDRLGQLRANAFDTVNLNVVETRTPGFATSYIKGYYNYSEGVRFVGGIDNLLDRNYLEHLDLRFAGPPTPNSGPLVAAYSPGFTAYGGIEMNW